MLLKNVCKTNPTSTSITVQTEIHLSPKLNSMSQTLFGNPKGSVELGKPNTCAEKKLCLIIFYSGSRSSLL